MKKYMNRNGFTFGCGHIQTHIGMQLVRRKCLFKSFIIGFAVIYNRNLVIGTVQIVCENEIKMVFGNKNAENTSK